MKARTIYTVAFTFAGLTAFSCGGKKPPPKEPAHVEAISDAGPEEDAAPPPPKSLYERLGKQEGIAQIVDTFMKNMSADPKVNKRIANMKPARLEKVKKDFADLICVEAGGPDNGADCKYEGRFMKEVLGAKSRFREDEWQAVLLALRNALEEHDVQNDEQQDLAAALTKFKDDTVEAPKPKGGKK